MNAARRRISGIGEFVKEWKRSSERSFGVGFSVLSAFAAAASLAALVVEENCLVVALLAFDFLGPVEWRARVAWADAIRETELAVLLVTNCLLKVAEHCPQTLEAARRSAGSIMGETEP